MKLSLIQSNQKVLYNPENPGKFDYETCKKLSEESIEENLRLIEEAAKNKSDLIVTTESINVSVFPNDARYNCLSYLGM